jgi:endonuclease-3
LFKKYPTAAKLAASKQDDVEKIVYPLGFFRAKATNIRKMAQALMDDHEGEVPKTLKELVALPGVGRKTANVVLGTAFDIPSGVVVDTHVKRICNLFGLTTSKNPEIIERDLMEVLPKKEWIAFSHRVILHGRATCVARKPRCRECALLKICPRIGLKPLDQ